MANRFWKIICLLFVGPYLAAFLFIAPTETSGPHIANYYLGELPTDPAEIDTLSRANLLVITPDQVIYHRDVLAALKRKNLQLIILAYVPSQSYNTRYWKNDLVFKNLTVRDEWWLKDPAGHKISNWPDLVMTNMSHGWSEYLVNFINRNIANLPYVDGIFFDMVNDGVSGVNRGNIALTTPGVADDPAVLDNSWAERVQYLLAYAHANLKTKYIVINGSSDGPLQPSINGRMFETFPTPWESNGSWSAIMSTVEKNQPLNQLPPIYIFNGNTHNTGNSADYRQVRFGLASSLLLDNVYFGFDQGDKSHHQTWWYDEYDVRLGDPAGSARSQSGQPHFTPDVWRRDYAAGVAIANSTGQDQTVDLGGEYEKIIGTQDKSVNDGSIVDTVTIGAQDGLLLYKTFQKIDNVFFRNGSFTRFYRPNGQRSRNGLFAFENNYPGGAALWHGDLDGSGREASIVAQGPKLEIFDSNGGRWFNAYPFGADFTGRLNVAVGKLSADGRPDIVVAPSTGGSVMVYDYHGGAARDNWYPLGKKYQGGFSAAVAEALPGAETDNGAGRIILSALKGGKSAETLVYDNTFRRVGHFYPFGGKPAGRDGLAAPGGLAAGNFDVPGENEIAAVGRAGKKILVRVFSMAGAKRSEFALTGLFGPQQISLGAASVTGDGRKSIVATTN